MQQSKLMSLFKDGAYYLYRHDKYSGVVTIVQQGQAPHTPATPGNYWIKVKWIIGNENGGLKSIWWTDTFQECIDEGKFTLMSWDDVLLAHGLFL